MELIKNLEKEGFEMLVEVNNYFPAIVKSGIYTLKSIHYNETTKEIKAVERKTVRSTTEYEKEIPLDVIKELDEKHPLKVILEALSNPDFNIKDVRKNYKI